MGHYDLKIQSSHVLCKQFLKFMKNNSYLLISQTIQIEITAQWCKLWFILLYSFTDSLTIKFYKSTKNLKFLFSYGCWQLNPLY